MSLILIRWSVPIDSTVALVRRCSPVFIAEARTLSALLIAQPGLTSTSSAHMVISCRMGRPLDGTYEVQLYSIPESPCGLRFGWPAGPGEGRSASAHDHLQRFAPEWLSGLELGHAEFCEHVPGP